MPAFRFGLSALLLLSASPAGATVTDAMLPQAGRPAASTGAATAGGARAVPAPPDTIRAPGSFHARTHVGADGSTLDYRLYVPSAHVEGGEMPLVVMLHGCTQNAADIAAGTRLNEVAEAEGFLVAYPEQGAGSHPFRCWRWFDQGHQARGAGEPELVAGMVRELLGELDVDPARIYVAGISAGAAMSVILAATYPDLFAAAVAHSGLSYVAAQSEESARHLLGGRIEDVATHARMAHRAMGDRARPIPLLVFHGSADPIVNPAHGADLAVQWAMTNRLATGLEPHPPEPEVLSGEAGGYAFTRTTYPAGDGGAPVVLWTVEGLGHAWSGGSPDGTFTDPRGPDATGEMVHFLLQHSRVGSRGD